MELLSEATPYLFNNWTIEACARLVTAAILGGLVGLEREHHGRSAGFRTQLLVCLGAAIAMVVSLHFGEVFGYLTSNVAFRVDPARVAYGVMGGVGFLGAGAIVKAGASVRGMTTAASLWCTAALGLACGFGMYAVAMMGTGLVLVALFFLGKIDQLIIIHWYRTIHVKMKHTGRDNLSYLRQKLGEKGLYVVWEEYTRNFVDDTESIRLHVRISSRQRPVNVNWFEGEPDMLEYQVR